LHYSWSGETGLGRRWADRRTNLRLFFYLTATDDLGVSAKFLVVAVGDVLGEIEILQQLDTCIDLRRFVFWQPYFIIDSSLFGDDTRALV
jgi:hypothetical protein